jgi:hypothetical protein
MRVFRKPNIRFVFRGFALIMLLAMLSCGWIAFIPSFNPTYIYLTLAHKGDVKRIVEPVYQADFLQRAQPPAPPPNIDVDVVYEYTSTCIAALLIVDYHNPYGTTDRVIALMRRDEGGNWQFGERDGITSGNIRALLPARRSSMTCSTSED